MSTNTFCKVVKRWCDVARSQLLNLLGVLLLFTYGFVFHVFGDHFTWSEIWFLQVVHRVMTGEVLYRDVFFSSTPLSVYISMAFAFLFGTELLVGKAVLALCFACTCVLSYRVARQLGLDQAWAMLVLGALLVWQPEGGFSYTPLVYFLLLVTLHAILVWQRDARLEVCSPKSTGTVALVIAGVGAGLGFASKQSVGVYLLAATCLSIAVSYYKSGVDKRQVLKDYALVLGAWFLTVTIVLLPVWLTGGVPRLIDYGVFGMPSYVRASIIPYRAQLDLLIDLLGRLIADPKPWRHLNSLKWQVVFLLPFPTFALLVWLWMRSNLDRRRLITVLLLFISAAFAGVFPRLDIGHMSFAVPVFVLGLVWACYQMLDQCKGRWLKAARTGLLFGCATVILIILITNIVWMRPRSGAMVLERCTWPHFRGILLPPDYIEEVHFQAEELKYYTGGQPTFILNPSAAFYYLLTGMKNPTPYDFPLAGAFGRNGQAEVIRDIQQGRIQYVCMSLFGSDPLAPVELEQYVQAYMEPIYDVGFCTLYRSRR